MALNIPERLVWAREQLAPAPNDRILEIGCGSGVLVSLICERLTDGQITGLDRSAHAITLARKRNRESVSSGKAILKVASFEKAALEAQAFEKIVAVHVNLFWTHPGRGISELRQALSKDGALYLVYHALPGGKTERLARILERGMREGGFKKITAKAESVAGSCAICVCARR